jgi:hypothetical protein
LSVVISMSTARPRWSLAPGGLDLVAAGASRALPHDLPAGRRGPLVGEVAVLGQAHEAAVALGVEPARDLPDRFRRRALDALATLAAPTATPTAARPVAIVPLPAGPVVGRLGAGRAAPPSAAPSSDGSPAGAVSESPAAVSVDTPPSGASRYGFGSPGESAACRSRVRVPRRRDGRLRSLMRLRRSGRSGGDRRGRHHGPVAGRPPDRTVRAAPRHPMGPRRRTRSARARRTAGPERPIRPRSRREVRAGLCGLRRRASGREASGRRLTGGTEAVVRPDRGGACGARDGGTTISEGGPKRTVRRGVLRLRIRRARERRVTTGCGGRRKAGAGSGTTAAISHGGGAGARRAARGRSRPC